MTVQATFRQLPATAKLLDATGSSAGTVTLASLANGSYRQTTKIDFGSSWAQGWLVEFSGEFAATPTAGNFVDVWCNPSSDSAAGNDNKGACSGTDAAYSGYSSNAADSVQHLSPVGSHRCSATATPTSQKSVIRERWNPPNRYCSFVIYNGAGVAFHSTGTNCWLKFTPIEPIAE